MAGHLALMKSVVYGFFLHSFMIYKWPSSLFKSLEKSIRNFLWTGSIHKKKLVTVNWDKWCKHMDEGGVGLKRLHSLNMALLGKIAWRLCAKEDFSYSFLRACFLSISKVVHPSHICSSILPSLKSSYKDIRSNLVWFPSSVSSLNFWNDNFLGMTIADHLDIPLAIRNQLNTSIADIFWNGS